MNIKIVGGAALAGIIGLFAYKYLKQEGGEDVDEPLMDIFKPRATSEPAGAQYILPQEPAISFPAVPPPSGIWALDPSGNLFWSRGSGGESMYDVPTKKEVSMRSYDEEQPRIGSAFMTGAYKGKVIGENLPGKLGIALQTGEYTPKVISESATFGKVAVAAGGGGYTPKTAVGGGSQRTGAAIMSLFGGSPTTGPGVKPTGPATPVTSETVCSAPRSKKEASTSQQRAAMGYAMSRATSGAYTPPQTKKEANTG